MEEIFKCADIISLHIPLNLETKYIINDDFIKKCRKPFYLINTSRGKCVKNSAIVKGLKEKKNIGSVPRCD